jgi:fructose-1,6-bisphosphatase
MVPDVHHILAKGSGVFCNPCSEPAPAKLRLLFECAPLAFIVEVRKPDMRRMQG